MKISTKGRYGLRAMVDLTVNSVTDHVALKSIAERQNISEGYLEQVFSMLKKAGLVKSIKGAQGGYTLADKASNITVGSILRVLEGSLSLTDEKDDSGHGSMERCIRLNVWDAMNKSINEIADGITLEGLAEDYRKMENTEAIMYYI